MAHCGALTFPERGRAERLEFPSSATQSLPDAMEILCDIPGKTNPWPKCQQLLFPHVLPSCAPWTAERLGMVQQEGITTCDFPVGSVLRGDEQQHSSMGAPCVALGIPGAARPWIRIPEANPIQVCWDLPCHQTQTHLG